MFAVISALTITFSAVTAQARLAVKETVPSFPTGWSLVRNNTTGNATVSVTSGIGSSKALSVVASDLGTAADDKYIVLEYTFPTRPSNAAYTLSFSLKGTYTLGSTWAGAANSLGTAYVFTSPLGSSMSLGDGWTKYTRSMGFSYAGAAKLQIRFNENVNVLIDDVVMTISGGNAVQNGGFENISESVTTYEIVTDPAERNPSLSLITPATDNYMPRNVLAYESADKATLSWINPVNAPSRVELYNTSGTLITDTLSATAQAKVKYQTDKGAYILKFEFADGQKREYMFDSKINPKLTVPGWSLEYTENASGVIPMSAWLDRTEKHGEKAALKLSSNATSESQDGRITLSQQVTFDRTKEYIMHIWSKTLDSSLPTVEIGESAIIGTVKVNEAWKCTEYIIQNKNGTLPVKLTLKGGAEAIWLDDIELYEYRASSPVGENLLNNSGFETDINTAPLTAVSGLDADENVGLIELLWTEASGNVRIYKKDAGNYVQCAEFGSTNSVRFDNLDFGTQYTYALTKVSENLNDSEKVEISATTEYPEYVIGAVSKSNAGSLYTISRDITYYGVSTAKTSELVVALVENGVITKVATQALGATPLSDGVPATLTVSIDIGSANAATSKLVVYTWDSLFKGNIITGAEQLNL